ncbi:MAG: hypothetical protein M1817_006318 [Caeruleum heppii]|nr:MAG: hypothetical protein M1817_006318 [Caeruleum heppii]
MHHYAILGALFFSSTLLSGAISQNAESDRVRDWLFYQTDPTMTYGPREAGHTSTIISKPSWAYLVKYRYQACHNDTNGIAPFDKDLRDTLDRGGASLGPSSNRVKLRENGTLSYTAQACNYFEWSSERNGYDELGVVITRDVKTPVFVNMRRLNSNKLRREGVWPSLFEQCAWSLHLVLYMNVCKGKFEGDYTSAGGTMAARALLHDAEGLMTENLGGPDMALRISIRADQNVSNFRCDDPYCLRIE